MALPAVGLAASFILPMILGSGMGLLKRWGMRKAGTAIAGKLASDTARKKILGVSAERASKWSKGETMWSNKYGLWGSRPGFDSAKDKGWRKVGNHAGAAFQDWGTYGTVATIAGGAAGVGWLATLTGQQGPGSVWNPADPAIPGDGGVSGIDPRGPGRGITSYDENGMPFVNPDDVRLTPQEMATLQSRVMQNVGNSESMYPFTDFVRNQWN